MADFSITGEVRLNSDPAEKSTSKWTIAAGQMIADFARKASSALESVVKSGITYNAGMENYLTNFKVMLGDEQLAAEKLEEIRKMAASTPFTLSDLTEGTQTLLQFGIAADDTTGVLKQLGDISLGNADKMQTLVRAYGKMSSAHKVTLENVNMMIDAGFNPLNQICAATGESMSDLYKRISDGKVGFEELQAAVSAATSEGGQFYNGMLEASQTFSGRLSTLQDNVSALVGELTNGLFSTLGDLISRANDLVVSITDDDQKMTDLKETIGLVTAVVAAAGAAFLTYKGYIAATSAATVVQTTATAALTAAHEAAASGATGLSAAQAALNTVMKANPIGLVVSALAALTAAFVTAYNTSETFRNIVNGAFQAVAGTAQSALSTAIGWLDQLSYKLNRALGKDAYSGYSSYEDYKSDKTTQQNRARRKQEAQAGKGISTKSWTERQAEADAAAKAAQQAEKTITSSANKAAAATQKAGGTVQKTVSEVVKSVTSTATTVKDGVTTTTESTTETLKNGTTQQKKVVTETSRQMVKGVLSDVKTITTTAADGSKTVTQSIEAVRDVLETTKDTHTTFADGVETTVEKVTETLADGSQQIKTVTTQTGTELVEGVNRTVKTITTEAADGSKTVEKVIEDAKDVVSTTKDTQTSLIHGVETTVEKTTELLKDGSEQVSTVTTQTGKEVIEGVERTVKTVTTKTAEGVETTVRTIEDAGPQYASAGELLTSQLRTKLDDGWTQIQSDIQTDALGAIESLATALKNGDLEKLGLWAASYFWQACTAEQQAQITSLATGALNQLGSALSGVGSNLAALASSLVAQFVPAAATATTAQGALNVAMDANPILLVISLIGMLVGALISFSGTNTDVANKFKSVWAGVQDFLSVIFEGLLRVVGLGIEGFVILINQLIDVYNSVAGLWDGKISRISNPAWDYADKIAADRKARQADRDKQDDALKANTAAILTANSKLAEMVKQADSLVLSDNMALSRSVAASGTARIAAAASSYTRQGDTVITQNIYSKAQTAADLQREARWEADRAKAQKH